MSGWWEVTGFGRWDNVWQGAGSQLCIRARLQNPRMIWSRSLGHTIQAMKVTNPYPIGVVLLPEHNRFHLLRFVPDVSHEFAGISQSVLRALFWEGFIELTTYLTFVVLSTALHKVPLWQRWGSWYGLQSCWLGHILFSSLRVCRLCHTTLVELRQKHFFLANHVLFFG